MTYPPPYEHEREKARLDALRPWLQAIAAGIAGIGLLGVILALMG